MVAMLAPFACTKMRRDHVMDIRLCAPLSFSLFISVRFVAVHALAHPTSRSTHCSLHSPPLSPPSSDSSLSCPGCCYSFQLNPDPVEIDCAGYGCHDPCAAKISNAQSSQTPYQNLAHPVATHPSHNDESSPLRLGCPQNPEQDVVVRHRQHVCVTLRNQCHCDHQNVPALSSFAALCSRYHCQPSCR